MKKAILTAAAALLLLLCIGPAASADVTYPDPQPLEVGQPLDHLAASVEPGSSVAVTAGSLPPGIDLELNNQGDATYVYLRGRPELAGDYSAVLTVNDESSFLCSVSVQPARPQVNVSPSVVCMPGDSVQLNVYASVSDGGTLSYQWYTETGASSSMIAGATDAVYSPGTAYLGTTYYFCVVTNNNNGVEVSVVSPAIGVTVQELSVSDVSIHMLPNRTSYTLGEQLDTGGLQLSVRYSDGSTKLVDTGFSLYPTLLDQVGTQTVEVSYLDHICRFTVQVADDSVGSIGVLQLPNKTVYTQGELLDPTGLAIRAYSNDLKSHRDISEGLVCSPMQLNSVGRQTITVSYEGKTCSFTVTVEEPEKPTYLSIVRLPDKLSYALGERVDTSGLVLREVTTRNNASEITQGFSVSPVTLDKTGQQEITVGYDGFTCSFSVNVTDAAQPSPSPGQQTPAAPVPTAVPTSVPTQASAAPVPTAHPARTVGSGRSFVAVIVIAALLALCVLGCYVYIMNRGGFDKLEEKLERFFRRRK